jgi:hypothetical protein
MTRSLGAGMLLAAMALILGSAPGQDVPGGAVYMRVRQFKVPFNIGPGDRDRLKQLQLYVSSDAGRTWQAIASAPPEQGYFRFSTPTDGAFWFAIQTFDKANVAFPENMNSPAPNLKMIVDTRPPDVALQPLTPRGGEVGVSWSVRDDNLNPNPFDGMRLEFRANGGLWQRLTPAVGSNQIYWNPNAAGAIEVRLQARDLAGNQGEGTARVSLDGAAFAPANPNNISTRGYDSNPTTILNPPAPSEVKLVNSKKIKLGYDVKESGPSGVSSVDLWYTHDGRTWKEYGQPLIDKEAKHLVFDVEREGQYGITLVAKSGVGLGERAPITGDRPQVWIEVDLTKPVVNVRGPLVGLGQDKSKLKIMWNASDKNLGQACIALSYAEQASAEKWTPIADKLNNTGEHIWLMPAQGVPFQFYLKVEAVDRAGNLGYDVTSQAVKVDLAIPRAIPLEVSPAN